jgi:plasmid stability protein
VATLNIKNVPAVLHRRLKARARRARRPVSQEVLQILQQAIDDSEPLSLLSLRGLGKEVWGETDPAAFVERERKSWT